MTPSRIIAIALIAGGIVALIVGMNASDSVADQVSTTFTGKYTRETQWYIIGGITAAVVGVAMLLPGLIRRKS
jgi:uncharacterized membrane protein YidH (DUF202 family)